ncbi:hypothetical protein TorRG33x02_139650 [Trema orientale]|uniref:Uncharacterized protein n=1 Tax=Trema orientale TaxID=63057 RepID=A0A2P5EXP5_TREOI|nr:hypothetical protein TorRG33x02_139650 [Trema orientale]
MNQPMQNGRCSVSSSRRLVGISTVGPTTRSPPHYLALNYKQINNRFFSFLLNIF